MRFKFFFYLVEGLLWTEVRLVVKFLDSLLSVLDLGLLGYLVFEELAVCPILLDPVVILDGLHAVHVVDGRVELVLLFLSQTLHALYL